MTADIIGIDISKDRLYAHRATDGAEAGFSNDAPGAHQDRPRGCGDARADGGGAGAGACAGQTGPSARSQRVGRRPPGADQGLQRRP